MAQEKSRQDLAARFEANRAHLRAVAYRMLGSVSEAEDAVQEAWLRLSRTNAGAVDNLGGWLTTVVARVCLDTLRTRRSRREEPLPPHAPETFASDAPSPDRDAAMADAVSAALLVVLEHLAPAERVAFVLHDMFDLPFDDIAPIVGRTPGAARQLASRARRRVRGADPVTEADRSRRSEVVAAFSAASRSGDFAALMAVLDPNVVLLADAAAVAAAANNPGAPKLAPEIHGAAAVAESFAGRARAAQPALIDGEPGLVWAPGGQVRSAFVFAIENGRVTTIDLVTDADEIAALTVVIS